MGSGSKNRVTGRPLIAALALVLLVGAWRDASATELVVNGNFETGTFGPAWVHGAYRGASTDPGLADHVVLPDLPYAGNYSALLGFKYVTQTTDAYGYMWQQLSIPPNLSSATLYFKIRQQGYDSTPYDPFRAQIRSSAGAVLQTILTQTFPEYNYQFKDSGWLDDDATPPAGFDMSGYAGQTIRLYFEQGSTIDNLYETWAYVDDVSLVYNMWVDLAVEGNGDNVYGAIASGAGAFAALGGIVGDTLMYDLVVQNEGNVDDTYQLTLTNPLGGPAWIEVGGVPQAFPYTTSLIAAGTSMNYRVFVVLPVGTTPGSYDLTVDAVSTVQGTRFDSALLRANVSDAIYGTDLVVDGNGHGVVGSNGAGGFALKQAPWDSTVTYDLEVSNTGDNATPYRMVMFPDAAVAASIWLGATQYTASFVTPAVPADSSLVMTLEMEVASPTQGADYTTIVQATATADTLMKDSIRAILRLRAPRVDLIIGTSGDDIYDDTGSGLGGSSTTSGGQGTPVSFPVIVQNEASVTDSFVLDWTSPGGGGWSASLVVGGVNQAFPTTTVALPPFSQVEYLLRINVPGGAAFSTFATLLDAVSATDNRIAESVSAIVSVSDASQGVDMVIDGSGAGVFGPKDTGLGGSSTQNAAPGDTLFFTIDLQNLAGPDSIDIEWSAPPGWAVTFDGLPAPIVGHAAGIYQLIVIVPPTSTGGTFDIIVDARKSDEPFYNDSVTGRVVVTPPVIVDAVIDGNGDEVFGALGSGLGGVSSQTRPVPSALNYTIELQNQGPIGDQYTLTWNSIPGWVAAVNSSPSPYVTTTVTAGGSQVLNFNVTIPSTATAGDYSYIIDVVSSVDFSVVESIEARATAVSPPRADMVIDGNGAGAFGTLGSGNGGTSVVGIASGGFFTSALELRNVGSFVDSFYVDWTPPSVWPAGSVLINDGSVDHAAPFWSVSIPSGGMLTYTVKAQVPVAPGTSLFETIIDAYSSLPPNSPESVRLVAQTFGVVTGIVFEDRDHDGVFGAGDAGLANVLVREDNSGQSVLTDGAGRYTFVVPSGASATVIEANPSGFISLSPDTVGPSVLLAGDTLDVDFADVQPLRLSAGTVLTGVAGGFVDFPHRLDAATTGQVILTATADPGVTTMFMLDANGNGIFDAPDRPLQPADIDMNPGGGNSTVYLLVRAFVPATLSPGVTSRVTVDASQTIGATSVTTMAQAIDAFVVVAGTLGRVTLQKSVDLGAATPGQVLTYTITFFNAGSDSVQNVVILDPVSQFVDPVPDAFGAGQDVEWQREGQPPVYLTLAPDADECDFDTGGRSLRLLLSKTTPYYLQPGETGTLTYRVIVK